jgi:hypothetical protein
MCYLNHCRHENELFFTWSTSQDDLRHLLQSVEQQHANIRMQVSIGSHVHFFGIDIDNRHGQLYTTGFHDSNVQRYTLPYVTHHPPSIYSDWLRYALIRAVCSCTLVLDFHRERLILELTYLANGYSLLFVEARVEHFFRYFNASEIRYTQDQTCYERFRRQIFEFVTRQDDLFEQVQHLIDHGHLFRFYYRYEYGPRCQFNREFHRLWTTHFQQHRQLSERESRIVLMAQSRSSLNTLLHR